MMYLYSMWWEHVETRTTTAVERVDSGEVFSEQHRVASSLQPSLHLCVHHGAGLMIDELPTGLRLHRGRWRRQQQTLAATVPAE